MMLLWLLALIAVGFTLVVFAVGFTAIGLAIRRLLGASAIDADGCFLSFWIGFASVVWLLILWNFFLPVRLPALVTVLTLAALCLAWSAPALMQAVRHGRLRPRASEAAILLVGAVWVSNQCLGPFESWDGVLYHLQGVAWAKAYAVVPGLANLRGPLAFNNSSFLYDAMVDSGIWEGRGFHIANGLLVFVSVLQGLTAALQWRRGGATATPDRLLTLLLLPVALYYVPEVTNDSTDLPMALMLAAAVIESYRLVEKRGRSPVDRVTVVTIALLLAGAISLKLSAAAFAITLLGVLFWRSGTGGWSHRRVWATAAVVWLLVLGPWAVRGIVLSGYPFFPLPYFGFPVDWRAPLEHARAEQAYIGFTERGFSWRIVGRGWLWISFGREASAVVIPTILAAIGVVSWRRLARRGLTSHVVRPTWFLLLPSTVATILWVLTAPSHRYAPVLFWTGAAVALTGWMRLALAASRLTARTALGIALSVAVASWVLPPLLMMATAQPDDGLALLSRSLVGPGNPGLHPLPVDFKTQPYTTNSGLVVYTPVPGTNEVNRPVACGNAPLPCTANPAPNLELRKPGSLQSGFRVRGDWQMRNWPYPWQPAFLEEWRRRQGQR